MRRRCRINPQRPAFSLVELLVVIAIIGVLAALLFPAIQMARESARSVDCKNNLRQIGLALTQFQDVHRHFPPALLQDPLSTTDYRQPPPYGDMAREISWMARILPFIEQDKVYSYVDFHDDFPWPNGELLDNGNYVNGQVIRLYQCPSYPMNRPSWVGAPPGSPPFANAHTDYLGVNGTDQFKYDGILHVNSRVRPGQIADGLSQTFIVGERPRSIDGWLGWWFAGSGMYPWFGAGDVVLGTEEHITNSDCACTPVSETSFFQPGTFVFDFDGYCYDKNAWHFWSPHSGGAHFLFADGHVDFVSYSINRNVFRARGTFAGGESTNEL